MSGTSVTPSSQCVPEVSGNPIRYVRRMIDRHGRERWYYRRDDRHIALPGDPALDQTAYNDVHRRFEINGPPAKRERYIPQKARPEATFTRAIERAIAQCRQRSYSKKRAFDIDAHWVRDQIAKQNCSCAITGIPFALSEPGKRNPYAPSLDRINSRKGYTKDNVRVVLHAVNLALSDWGDEVFTRVCMAVAERKRT